MTDYSGFEKTIGYTFKDKTLLDLAMTHSSYANENHHDKNFFNERIEFLGDAVLELISSEYFYINMPEKNEGEMTKQRASMVCEPTLAFCARQIYLPEYIKLGRGEEFTGGRERDSIISDAFEALIGAIYLDSGFSFAKEFVLKFVLNDIDKKRNFYDSKTILQEKFQRSDKNVSYTVLAENGPDHNKSFTVGVMYEGKIIGQGTGRTKKAAEQKAAYEALIKLKQDDEGN